MTTSKENSEIEVCRVLRTVYRLASSWTVYECQKFLWRGAKLPGILPVVELTAVTRLTMRLCMYVTLPCQYSRTIGSDTVDTDNSGLCNSVYRLGERALFSSEYN